MSENNQYFEIDIYPEWDKQAIMEIELNDEKEAINVPKMIKIIKEVTEDDIPAETYESIRRDMIRKLTWWETDWAYDSWNALQHPDS